MICAWPSCRRNAVPPRIPVGTELLDLCVTHWFERERAATDQKRRVTKSAKVVRRSRA